MQYRFTRLTATAAALPLLLITSVFAQEGGGRPKPLPDPPDKAKPAPRLADGKVDLNGKGVWAPIWVLDWADSKYVAKDVDVPFTPEGLTETFWIVAPTIHATIQKVSVCRQAFRAIRARLIRSRFCNCRTRL